MFRHMRESLVSRLPAILIGVAALWAVLVYSGYMYDEPHPYKHPSTLCGPNERIDDPEHVELVLDKYMATRDAARDAAFGPDWRAVRYGDVRDPEWRRPWDTTWDTPLIYPGVLDFDMEFLRDQAGPLDAPPATQRSVERTEIYGISVEVKRKVDQRTLPPEARIPDCLEGVPVQIYRIVFGYHSGFHFSPGPRGASKETYDDSY